jgi:hypothetical protein
MKWDLKVDFRILLILCLVFAVLGAMGWALLSRPTVIVNTIVEPDSLMIRRNDSLTRVNRQLLADKACPKVDTFRMHDTTYIIQPSTPFGDIPVRRDEFKDSLPLTAQGKRFYMPFYLGITYRGVNSGYDIRTIPRPYNIPIKQPSSFRFEGGVEGNLSTRLSNLSPIGVLSIGASYKHFRIMGYGLLGPNVPGWIMPRLGIGWCL